jgi:hypothetical protein
MSALRPYTLRSLQKMGRELAYLNKRKLTYDSLEQLLTKYRDGLVGSGVYNEISRLLAGQQYITDPDQLNALRLEIIERVNATIASLDGQDKAEAVLAENVLRSPAEPATPIRASPSRAFST